MIFDAEELARVRKPVAFTCGIAWTLLLFAPQAWHLQFHCTAPSGRASTTSIRMLLTMDPPVFLALGWALMLTAMMSPALLQPLRHIRMRSFTRRRSRSIALFLAGYAAIWMAFGLSFLAAALPLQLVVERSYTPVVVVALIALIWQCSPTKQRCLNRCHALPTLAAFGTRADRDAFHFGFTQGIWCAGSCWALMLLPLLLHSGHLLVMGTITLMIFSERLELPAPPAWHLHGPRKLFRILLAQIPMRFSAFRQSRAPLPTSIPLN